MADSQVFRSFLVNLGFKVDTASQNSFKESVGSATKQVNQLAAALKSAAITAAIVKIAKGFEDLYYSSQRVRGSAGNIDAYGKAISQLGGSAASANGSLEAMAQNLRNAPGHYGMLESLGIQTKTANGELRDTVELMVDLGGKLRGMDQYKANAYASALGIDEKTALAMRNGSFDAQYEKYKRMRRELGLSGTEAAKEGQQMMSSIRDIMITLELVTEKVSMALGKMLLPILQNVSAFIVGLTKRYEGLDESTKTMIARIGGVITAISLLSLTAGVAFKVIGIAWGLLNARFLATPIGAMMALMAAFALLADDYMVWKDGGTSALDWGGMDGTIQQVISAIDQVAQSIGGWETVGSVVLAYFAGKWVLGMLGAFAKVGAGAFAAAKNIALFNPIVAGAIALITPSELGDGTRYKTERFDKDGVPYIRETDNLTGGVTERPYKSKQEQDRDRANGGTGSSPGPRGIRNNNPGNLQYTPMAAKRMGGSLENHSTPRFAAFDSEQEGLNALAVQLKRYANAGMDSVREIVAKYAPPSENKTQSYIDSVAKKLGVGANDTLNMSDPKVMQAMTDAIVKHENGRNPYSSEMMARAAQIGVQHKGKFGGGWGDSPPIQQTNNITVTGVSNPQEAASRVQGAQGRSNDMLVGNVRLATR